MKLLTKWMICVAVFLCAFYIFPGHIYAQGGVKTLVVAATILWLVNLLLRPVVQLIALPVTLLTLGIFSLVVNAAMVCLTDAMMPQLKISSFFYSFLIALAISIAGQIAEHGQKD